MPNIEWDGMGALSLTQYSTSAGRGEWSPTPRVFDVIGLHVADLVTSHHQRKGRPRPTTVIATAEGNRYSQKYINSFKRILN